MAFQALVQIRGEDGLTCYTGYFEAETVDEITEAIEADMPYLRSRETECSCYDEEDVVE